MSLSFAGVMLYSHCLRVQRVQSFLGSILENRGILNKSEEQLAKLEELVIFLLSNHFNIAVGHLKSVSNVQSL